MFQAESFILSQSGIPLATQAEVRLSILQCVFIFIATKLLYDTIPDSEVKVHTSSEGGCQSTLKPPPQSKGSSPFCFLHPPPSAQLQSCSQISRLCLRLVLFVPLFPYTSLSAHELDEMPVLTKTPNLYQRQDHLFLSSVKGLSPILGESATAQEAQLDGRPPAGVLSSTVGISAKWQCSLERGKNLTRMGEEAGVTGNWDLPGKLFTLDGPLWRMDVAENMKYFAHHLHARTLTLS